MSQVDKSIPNKKTAYFYVLIQAFILGTLIFVNYVSNLRISNFQYLGDVLKIIGIFIIIASAFSIRKSLTAMPLPKQNGALSTRGLYKYVRHPMYTGVITFSLGIALSSGEIYKYLLVFSLVILFYFKSEYEEKYLAYKYKGYQEYTNHTPRFIPKF